MAQGKTQIVTIQSPKKQVINQQALPVVPIAPVVKRVELVVVGGALVPDKNELEPGVNSKDF